MSYTPPLKNNMAPACPAGAVFSPTQKACVCLPGYTADEQNNICYPNPVYVVDDYWGPRWGGWSGRGGGGFRHGGGHGGHGGGDHHHGHHGIGAWPEDCSPGQMWHDLLQTCICLPGYVPNPVAPGCIPVIVTPPNSSAGAPGSSLVYDPNARIRDPATIAPQTTTTYPMAPASTSANKTPLYAGIGVVAGLAAIALIKHLM